MYRVIYLLIGIDEWNDYRENLIWDRDVYNTFFFFFFCNINVIKILIKYIKGRFSRLRLKAVSKMKWNFSQSFLKWKKWNEKA